MGTNFDVTPSRMDELAERLKATRRAQGLSRLEAAAVCGVSVSFVRDAETHPHTCSLGHLSKLIGGLGLSIEVGGLTQIEPPVTSEARQASP